MWITGGPDVGTNLSLSSTTEMESEGSSLADALFSLHSQQEGLNIEGEAPRPNATVVGTTPSNLAVGSAPSAPESVHPTAASTPSPTKNAPSQPSPIGRRGAAPLKRATSATKGKDLSKAKNGASLRGQTSLQSFFAKPKSTPPTPSIEPAKVIDLSQETYDPTAAASAVEEAVKNADGTIASSAHNTYDSAAPFDDTEDAISDFHETANASPTSQHTAQPSEQSAADRVGASLAWGAIFSPAPAPLCRNHSEACRAWTVNKPGPNHGRKFWLCNRPVGPGYEKSGRAKGDVNPEYRCNFFVWDSDLRSKKGKAGEGAGGEGKFFAEVGRERGRKGGRMGEQVDGEELGGPWGPHKRVKTGDAS